MSNNTRFGTFFRQKRGAIGLSLREFCRQNGFDPGNTSRLELGRTKPPRSKELLESYAQALQLEPDSHDWRTFIDLAAAETGRVPVEIAEDRAASEKLPEVYRALRRERRRDGTWSGALDLESWADYLDARSQLPRLLRRLIHATTQVEHIAFAAGEGIQRPGWDGIVESSNGSAFVPAGRSVWECGVNRDIQRKATKDFAKRTKNPLGVQAAEATYLFVTPRKWLKKEAWCTKSKEVGIWHDVRVYDSSDLEAWLEIAPAVDAWFARLLGRRPAGVTDVNDYWDDLSAITSSSLKPELFLASREQEIKTLEDWLLGPPSALAGEARSPTEVLDFLAAYTASLKEDESEKIASRVLIVSEVEAWQALASGKEPLVLAAKPELEVEAEMVASAVRNGHHVLLCSTRFCNTKISKLPLPRCPRQKLEEALRVSGFEEKEASRRARESGGSLTVLKRHVARFPNTKHPAWSQSESAVELAPLVLIGAWQDGMSGDRQIIEKVTGRRYKEVLKLATRWLHSEDSPLMRLLSQWSLMSREDAWVMLGRYVTEQQLDAFEEAAYLVLEEVDPQLELSRSEQIMAQLDGKNLSHSATLRKAFAESLALMGARPESLSEDPVGGKNRAARIVRKLLEGDMSWKRWASLSNHLPILAEAAPEVFLAAVSSDVKSDNPQLASLFEDDGDPMFSACRHAGLLWALECTAWSPDYLLESSLLLACLDEQDQGNAWANRPFNSLVEIFLPWLPHTATSVEQRIKVLHRLTKQIPTVGWKLLLKLLPSLHGSSSPTYQPAWRDWAMESSRGVTNAEYWKQVEASAKRLLEMLGSDAQRWLEVIDELENFPKEQQTELLERLKSFNLSQIAAETQKNICEKLSEKARRHRAFPDARWVWPIEVIEQLELAANHFEPDDVVARNRWLFVTWPQYVDETNGVDDREKKVAEARQRALKEVFEEGGLPRIVALAKNSESPFAVGFELAKFSCEIDDKDILPHFLESDSTSEKDFACGFVSGQFNQGGWSWVESQDNKQWSVETVVRFAVMLESDRRTWDWVESLGAEILQRYWQQASLRPYPKSREDVKYAVSHLLQAARPFTAIDLLAMALHRKLPVEAELIMETLKQAKEITEEDLKEKPHNNLSYEIQELFRALQSQSDQCDLEELAKLEWAYLNLLDGHGASPETLYSMLQSEPKFFADVLKLIFRSEDAPEEEAPTPSEDKQNRIANAYELLLHWKVVPGTSEDGTLVDEEQLLAWLREVRQLAKTSGHLKICDSRLGELFAHAPAEADGSWPCLPVRDAIDEIGTEEVERGFVIGILNKRGVYSKSPLAGGERERGLATRYKVYAEASRAEWPRVAAALRSVVRHYEEDAKREDARAEARK